MTPYELRILLDVYVGTPIGANPAAPIYDETIAALEGAGWMTPYSAPGFTHLRTEKLIAFMGHVLSAPPPVSKWVMP